MANNLAGLNTAIKQAFGANLDAATIQKLRDRFVAAYQGEWEALKAANGGAAYDTAANRNQFAADRVLAYIKDIYQAGSAKEIHAAAAQPEALS